MDRHCFYASVLARATPPGRPNPLRGLHGWTAEVRECEYETEIQYGLAEPAMSGAC
jgi:hypothetical protein